MAADYKNGILRVKNLWLEHGIRMTKKLRTAVERALVRFSKFNNCGGLEVQDILDECGRFSEESREMRDKTQEGAGWNLSI